MDEYYVNQAGSGFTPFSGVRYQKGNGFFGRIISGGFLPLLQSVLPYLGKKALHAGANIADDLMDGKSFKESAVRNLKEYGRTIGRDAVIKIRQKGKGGMVRKGKCKLTPSFAKAIKFANEKKRKIHKRTNKREGKRKAESEDEYPSF